MKNMKFAVLNTLLLSTIILGATTVIAAEGATPETPATRNTDAIVTFLENTDPEGPVDPGNPELPVDPEDPIDPENPPAPGTGGPLSLDYASALNFGKHKISTKDEVYYANSQKVTPVGGTAADAYETNLYGQVTDKRAKNELVGWTLSVTQNGQFKTAKNAVLEGAQISFLKGNTNTVSENEVNQPSEVQETINLEPGTTHKLVTALEGEGSGTWVYRMGTEADIAMVEEETINEAGETEKVEVSKDKAVTLSVPGATTKVKDEVYKTTLTWTLSTVAGEEEGD